MTLESCSIILRMAMRGGPAVFLVIILSFSAYAQKPVDPGKRFKLDGITLTSPDQKGWHVSKSDKLEIIFEFSNAGTTSRAFAKIHASNAQTDDTKFFEDFEAVKIKELESLEGLERDSIHFNRVSFNETACVQYDSSLKNLAATMRTFEYYNIYGYVCSHPLSKDWFVQLEFSTYSNAKGFSEADRKLYRRYFNSAQFTKITGR